jgi:hypothetical protein
LSEQTLGRIESVSVDDRLVERRAEITEFRLARGPRASYCSE